MSTKWSNDKPGETIEQRQRRLQKEMEKLAQEIQHISGQVSNQGKSKK